MTIIASLAMSGRPYIPKDGERQDVWYVTGGSTMMPEDFSQGKMWDLTYAISEARVTRHYRMYGDTLLTRTSGKERDFFVVKGDTVLSLGSASRTGMSRCVRGAVPYILPSLSERNADISASITMSRPFDHKGDLMLSGYVSLSKSGGFIFATGDTVPETTLVHTHATDGTCSLDTYRWYAERSPYPVVELQESVGDDGAKDTPVTLICPPSEQPAEYPQARKGPQRTPSAPAADVDGPCPGGTLTTPPYLLEYGSGSVSVIFQTADTGQCEALLCDAQGRIYASSSGSSSFEADSLPPGTYIMYIRVGEDSYSHTFNVW